jgi:hypothetical protein
MICLDAHIWTIIILTCGKLTEIYFLHLFYAIYFSVTTHQWKGKKVSILPPGVVNPGPVPSRWDLLEDSLYHAVRVACLWTSHDRAPRTWGPRNVLWSFPQDVNTFSWRMQLCPCSVKCTGVTWEISGDVCHIYVYCVFCRYANHIWVGHIIRANHRVEYDLPPCIRMPFIFGKSFSFGEEQIGPTWCHDIAFSCCILTKWKP